MGVGYIYGKQGKVQKMAVLEHEPITASESEQPALLRIRGVLNNSKGVPKLVGPDGEEIVLPGSVFELLRQVVYHMMQGKAVFIIPENQELTTQEAADILNVSRPYLVKLLKQGVIPFIKIGTHRRVRFIDLINYKKQRDAERLRAINEIAQMSQDAGLYD